MYTSFSLQRHCSLRIKSADIREYLSTNVLDSSIVRPNQSEFLQRMLGDDIKSSFFPDKYIVVNWEPFQILRSNLIAIYNEREVVWTPDEDGNLEWMTFRYAFPCNAGLKLDLDMYGVNPRHIIPQMLHSLSYAMNEYPDFHGTVEVIIYTARKFSVPREEIPIATSPGAISFNEFSLVVSRNMLQNYSHL